MSDQAKSDEPVTEQVITAEADSLADKTAPDFNPAPAPSVTPSVVPSVTTVAAPSASAAAEAAPSPAASDSPSGAPVATAAPSTRTGPDVVVTTPTAKVKGQAISGSMARPSKIVIGLGMAVIGVGLVAIVTLFTPTPTRDQDIPYLLEPLEKHLDANLRYKPPQALERKDWRNEFVVEQTIWTNEVSKIIMGAPDAKPIEDKREYLLYLADSYFKDEPHFAEAKAAYLSANASPRIPHEKAFDYGDDELWRRIGYCDIRLGFYDEAESWLKRALQVNADGIKARPKDISLIGTRNRILDNLAENYSRKGEPKIADQYVKKRLDEMGQVHADQCVELPVLYNIALAREREGDLKEAERFYKLAIVQCDIEDLTRGKIVPESIYDNNRSLARVLMNYSHMLRLDHRNDEAIATMRRALCIYDNPPHT